MIQVFGGGIHVVIEGEVNPYRHSKLLLSAIR